MASPDGSSVGRSDASNPVLASILDPDLLITPRPAPRQGGWTRRRSICCMAAIEIADYQAQPVFDQIRLTQTFHELLSFATSPTTPEDLVSIAREDGALLCFNADSKTCFMAALKIRKATSVQERYRCLPLRIALDLCEVEMGEDQFGNAYVGGAGRQDVERLMRQCIPHEICATRSFVEVLSRTAPPLAGLLQYQGMVSDTAPALGYYRLDTKAPALANIAQDTPPADGASLATAADVPDLVDEPMQRRVQRRARNRRRQPWPTYVLIMLLAVCAAAAWLHWSHGTPQSLKPSNRPTPITPASPPSTTEAPTTVPAPLEVSRSSQPSRNAAAHPVKRPAMASGTSGKAQTRSAMRPADRPAPTAAFTTPNRHGEPRKAQQAAAAQTMPSAEFGSPTIPRGTLQLAIKPWGQVYVDGTPVGVTPPLRTVQLGTGRHQVTITNGSLPMYEKTVIVKPDATMRLTHDFRCTSGWDNPCQARLGRDSSYALRQSSMAW